MKTSIQDHSVLAARLYGMAKALRNKASRQIDSDVKFELLKKASDLEDQADDHFSKFILFGSKFTMILR